MSRNNMHYSHPTVSKNILSFDGTVLYYEITPGTHNSKCLILLHGLGGDLTAWNREKQILLKNGYTIIAIDLRGHGFSGRPDDIKSYSLRHFAKDIVYLIRKEKLHHPVIIGHCFGGMIGLIIAALYPDTLHALILVDTSYKPPYYSLLVLHHKSFRQFLHFIALHISDRHIAHHIDFNRFKGSTDYNWRRILSDVAHMSLKTYLSICENLSDYDATYLMQKISIPTLIVAGQDDTVFPTSIADVLHKRIIASDLNLIKKGNHILVINSPRQLTDVIVKFLDKIHY